MANWIMTHERSPCIELVCPSLHLCWLRNIYNLPSYVCYTFSNSVHAWQLNMGPDWALYCILWIREIVRNFTPTDIFIPFRVQTLKDVMVGCFSSSQTFTNIYSPCLNGKLTIWVVVEVLQDPHANPLETFEESTCASKPAKKFRSIYNLWYLDYPNPVLIPVIAISNKNSIETDIPSCSKVTFCLIFHKIWDLSKH